MLRAVRVVAHDSQRRLHLLVLIGDLIHRLLCMPKRRQPGKDKLSQLVQKRNAKARRTQSRAATKEDKPTKRYGAGLPGRNVQIDIRNVTPELKKQAALEYCKDFNVLAAAQRTGIKRGTMWQLVHKDTEFMALVRQYGGEAVKESGMSLEETLIELKRIGSANILDYMTCDEDGELVFDLAGATRAQMAAVLEIQQDEETLFNEVMDAEERAKPQHLRVHHIKLRLHGKMEALKIMAQHHKITGSDVPPGAPGSPGGTTPPALMVQFTADEEPQQL